MQKLLTFFQQKFCIYAIFNDQSFNDTLHVTNFIVSFEQLGPVIYAKRSLSAKKVLYAIFFSGEGTAIQVPVKRVKALIENTTKMWYLRNWKKKNTIRNGAQSWVSNMSDFYMIMPSPNVCHCHNVFARREGSSFTTPCLFTRPWPLRLLFFRNRKPSSLERDISSDKRLDLPYTSI